jgi:hypothetical protein
MPPLAGHAYKDRLAILSTCSAISVVPEFTLATPLPQAPSGWYDNCIVEKLWKLHPFDRQAQARSACVHVPQHTQTVLTSEGSVYQVCRTI